MSRPKRLLVLFVVVAALAVGLWLRFRPKPIGEAFVARRQITLWSRLGQVREEVTQVGYGQRVAIYERRDNHLRVRSAAGFTGWVSAEQVMEPDLWRNVTQLVDQARAMTAQARGHTKVTSNLRLEPSRESPRVFQLRPQSPLEVLGRSVAERPANAAPSSSGSAEAESSGPRREDWLLARGESDEGIALAGWVLGRFIELDLPDPLRDLGSGIRFIAWRELNRVLALDGEKPQYVAAGVVGGEGQPCDFTHLRVYTWDSKRGRYETAYVESRLCGKLPIDVEAAPAGPIFRFAVSGSPSDEPRAYQMRHTLVRRLSPGRAVGK